MVSAFEQASGKVANIHLLYGYRRCGVFFTLESLEQEPDFVIVLVMSQKIPLRFAGRRPGDSSEVYAATEKAEKELGWR